MRHRWAGRIEKRAYIYTCTVCGDLVKSNYSLSQNCPLFDGECIARTKERKDDMYNQLKNLSIDRIDLDEAVALLAFARLIQSEYITGLLMPVPEWITDRINELTNEVRARTRDAKQKRVRQLQAQLDAMKPAEVRREEMAAELTRLKGELG